MTKENWIRQLQEAKPKVHCLTNPVTMQDVANILLTAGGSAIMGQEKREVQEITSFCQATLLNTGVPDDDKFCASILAGVKANELGHPVVLDPVGAGATQYRRDGLERLLKEVRPTLIRCNQEEACALLHIRGGASGGVESSVHVEEREQLELAGRLARACGCTVLVSGKADAVSDGTRSMLLAGGDPRIARVSGSGCMLSALCALFCGAGLDPYEAARTAGSIWKEASRLAGIRTDQAGGGMGSFHVYLFDALDQLCHTQEK